MADRTVTVSPSGGDYTSLYTALNTERTSYPSLITDLDGILTIQITGTWSSA